MTTDTTTTGTAVFRMPSLGADMTEGRITEWLVQPGERVERGQIVVIVETDKADIDVEVFEPATVTRLIVAEGDLVPVGAPIAELAPDTAPPSPGGSRVTSPVIRHLAEELHVDPSGVRGTGPGGRVRRDDIVTAGAPPRRATDRLHPLADRQRITPRARWLLAEHGLSVDDFTGHGLVTGDDVIARAAEPELEPVDRSEAMRRRIAGLMATSWKEIPHFHVSSRIDLQPVTARLAVTNADRPAGDRIVVGAMLLAATARAAAAVPACNGWWRDGRFEAATTVDLGVVLSLRSGGIIVPTIPNADQLGPRELMAHLDELVQRARQGRLRASDLHEASITATNLGDRGADTVSGVIHPPQVALVGFGTVHDELWPIEGDAVVRPTVQASLAGDHRAIDGLTASRFLTRLRTVLDGPLLDDC